MISDCERIVHMRRKKVWRYVKRTNEEKSIENEVGII